MTEGQKEALKKALETAAVLKATPEMAVTTGAAKDTIEALANALNANPCYLNATLRGQESFTMIEQDSAGPEVLELWATITEDNGGSQFKIADARERAARWTNSPVEKKAAD